VKTKCDSDHWHSSTYQRGRCFNVQPSSDVVSTVNIMMLSCRSTINLALQCRLQCRGSCHIKAVDTVSWQTNNRHLTATLHLHSQHDNYACRCMSTAFVTHTHTLSLSLSLCVCVCVCLSLKCLFICVCVRVCQAADCWHGITGLPAWPACCGRSSSYFPGRSLAGCQSLKQTIISDDSQSEWRPLATEMAKSRDDRPC